jgi:hypothetical protein
LRLITDFFPSNSRSSTDVIQRIFVVAVFLWALSLDAKAQQYLVIYPATYAKPYVAVAVRKLAEFLDLDLEPTYKRQPI